MSLCWLMQQLDSLFQLLTSIQDLKRTQMEFVYVQKWKTVGIKNGNFEE